MASSNESGGKPNRLINEKSPYLLQHAYNPVDWYPWSSEAFDEARKKQKPIFLSVGYSTCHWCHVMERESFENEKIGRQMNEQFVNIKVDREERPDVDRVYMTFIQAISGGGGWPMSVFLTPDLKPITGGTYFPPDDTFGRRGFSSVLTLISDQWNKNRNQVLAQSEMITEQLKKISLSDNDDNLSGENQINQKASNWLLKCYRHLQETFDSRRGGFGSSPKFPQPVNLEFLLQFYFLNKNDTKGAMALNMIEKTLQSMADGGIHDHIGLGFHRYSVDGNWHVPHFEKMLYDQAQLASVYADCYLITGNHLYRDIVEDILAYVNRDLSHPEGGFYSAEDADSYPITDSKEKREGAFCVWEYDAIEKLLTSHETETEGSSDLKLWQIFRERYNIDPRGNVDRSKDPHHELTNQNVLMVNSTLDTIATKMKIPLEKVSESLKLSHKILAVERGKRPKPHLDDKMIAAWNGLMLGAFAKAGRVLKNEDYIERAKKSAEFIRKNLVKDDKTGRSLLRSCYSVKSGDEVKVSQIKEPIDAFSDDYAFLIQGLLELYQTTLEVRWLQWADELQTEMNKIFWNGDCYYSTSGVDESILIRMKGDQDGAEPATNSVAASNLLMLADCLFKDQYREQAIKIFGSYSKMLERAPFALPKMLVALSRWQQQGGNPQIVILSKNAPEKDQRVKEFLSVIHSRYIPDKSIIILDGTEGQDPAKWVSKNAEHLKDVHLSNDETTVFLCRNYSCSLPTNDPKELERNLFSIE